MREDELGWLLPDAGSEECAALRRVITALRLLRDDARARALRVEPSWPRARAELEALERRRSRRAIEGLLHAYLSAQRTPDSFLDLGPRPEDYGAAWRTLLGSLPAAGFPPVPSEPPRAIVARLLEAGARQSARPAAAQAWHAWWEAAARHLVGPPAEAERCWAALFARACETRARPPFLARVLRGLVAARLERFQPARAWSLFARHAHLVASDRGLRQALGWSALLVGDVARARQLLQGEEEGAWLPQPLVELRADRPEWSAFLRGTSGAAAAAPPSSPLADRRVFGAHLLAVLALDPDGVARTLALDVAGALRSAVRRRLSHGLEAWTPEVEDEAPDEAQVWRLRSPEGCGMHPEALAGSATRALVRVPVRGRDHRLAGWIQLEAAQLLLPSSPGLRNLAAAWRPTILARQPVRPGETPTRPRAGGRAARAGARSLDPGDPRRAFCARLFRELGPLAGGRAFWIEFGPGEELWILAERGAALGGWQRSCGEARAIRRAREERLPVFYRSSRTEGLHAGALRGCALPLRCARGARALGCLVLESTREDWPSEALVGEVRTRLEALRALWWSTAFQAHTRAEEDGLGGGEGGEVLWDPERRFPTSLEPALASLSRTRAPLLVVGARGSGRRTLARWIAFRARGAAGVEPAALLPRTLELGALGREAQVRLCASLGARRDDQPLPFLIAEAPAHVLREGGRLVPELERRLDPLPLHVPALVDRRDEIPGLARMRAAEVARREQLARAHLADEALALLWRQDWPGNVAELFALVTQLARAHPGRRVGAAEVQAALRSRGIALRRRLPSRRPRALDLELALATTRHRNGNENRSRAARYLGWDPDTLLARLERGGVGRE